MSGDRGEANADSYDLIGTDINMPQLDGVQLAGRLLARDANSKAVFMTGRNDQEIALLPLRGTRAAVLHQPFAVSQLLHFGDENLAMSNRSASPPAYRRRRFPTGLLLSIGTRQTSRQIPEARVAQSSVNENSNEGEV